MHTSSMNIQKRYIFLILSLALVALAWFGSIDINANSQVNAGLKRALATYASARTLNAVISVAQGTEVSIQPLGFGVNLTPGQVLSPINELVEQFSDVMLLASVAFGIQKILILIGSHWLVSALLTGLILAGIWFSFRTQNGSPAWLNRGILLLLLLRFAVPVSLIGTELLFNSFMKSDYETSQGAIASTSRQVADLSVVPKPAAAEPSILEKIKGWSPGADISTGVQNFKNAVESTTEHVIKLIVLFLMQTLVLSILLLWCLFGMTKSLLKTTAPDK